MSDALVDLKFAAPPHVQSHIFLAHSYGYFWRTFFLNIKFFPPPCASFRSIKVFSYPENFSKPYKFLCAAFHLLWRMEMQFFRQGRTVPFCYATACIITYCITCSNTCCITGSITCCITFITRCVNCCITCIITCSITCIACSITFITRCINCCITCSITCIINYSITAITPVSPTVSLLYFNIKPLFKP